jgi:hypothetical protein
VRHETCLNCRAGEVTDPRLKTLIMISESVGAMMHHHHTMKCDGCGGWWFDDVVIGGLGIPVPVRRDTEMCGCEDGLPQYTTSATLVPVPDDQCACTKAETEERTLQVRLGERGRGTP